MPFKSLSFEVGELLQGLPLAAATPPGWVEIAAADLDALLIDHAHCELKAAANAVAMAGRFAEEAMFVRDLTALAREELRHFELVHRRLCDRGGRLSPPRPDLYVRRLSRLVRRGGGRATALLDQLLLCGFIEARSCERFRLLANAAPVDPSLRAFYGELAEAEARHHELFFDHAVRLNGEEAVERWREVGVLEGALVRELPLGPRMH